MVATFLFGTLLLLTPGIVDWGAWWIYAKLTFILIMSAIHGLFSHWRRDFELDRNIRAARFYRLMNEVPTVLMIGIVIFVVVKPGTG